MNKTIQELHKLISEASRGGDVTQLHINDNSDYYRLTADLLHHALPAGKENRYDFLKGLVFLENGLHLGSTSQFYKFMKRLDLYEDVELMDWILANRNNSYIPFGSYHPSLEVRSYSEYQNSEKGRQEHRERMTALDMERSRTASERKEKNRLEHAERKRINDGKRKHANNNSEN